MSQSHCNIASVLKWLCAVAIPIVTIIFYTGKYVDKIETLEKIVNNQTQTINTLQDRVSSMIAVLQNDYTNFNVNAYIDNAIKNHNQPSKIAKGLKELKKKDADSGAQYLQDYYNFDRAQVKSVFTPIKNANSSHSN